jgi:hypothetical protein
MWIVTGKNRMRMLIISDGLIQENESVSNINVR